MDLIILDEDFSEIGVIDAFESLIWTDRYYEAGDFELLTMPNAKNISNLMLGKYAAIKESEHFMVIEDIHIVTNPVEGNKLTIKGRSGESILERRNITSANIFNEVGLNDAAFALINDNVITPTSQPRVISNLEYESTEDDRILAIEVSNQYSHEDDLYLSIVDLCLATEVGFKITLTDEAVLLFTLYAGVDRSYDQLDNPYIVFSPDFENLKNSTYMATTRTKKTVCYVGGEKGVENAQQVIEVDPSSGAVTGIDRREMYIDAQDVSRVDEDGEELSDEEYEAQLRQRGLEELSRNEELQTFSSEVDPFGDFVYGTDFFLGDILQVSNEYGFEGKSRVIEVIRTQDLSGIKIYPIFSAI